MEVFPFTAKMSLKRFQQIRSVLAFNSPDSTTKQDGKKDALHKVRPILNIWAQTNLLQPEEAVGEFHFRAYCLCCPETNVMVGIRFATRDASERVSPTNKVIIEEDDEDKEYFSFPSK